MNPTTLLNFLFELGTLRRIKHEGWRIAGIEHPESVADHSLRAAQIGYFLAKLEKFENPHLISTMIIFHDSGECRIGDIHKIANRYIQADEEAAVKDQLKNLGETGEEVFGLWKDMEERKTDAGIIAKDADLLEQGLTAWEYIDKGYSFAKDWIDNISKGLQTESAKNLLSEMQNMNPNDWWQGLKKID